LETACLTKHREKAEPLLGQSIFGPRRVSLWMRWRKSIGEEEEEDVFRLTIPVENAFAFAMGEVELGPGRTPDLSRQLVGILIIDALEYAEKWRLAAEARAVLASRWPHCPGFRNLSRG
jgi:hypothetical protein